MGETLKHQSLEGGDDVGSFRAAPQPRPLASSASPIRADRAPPPIGVFPPGSGHLGQSRRPSLSLGLQGNQGASLPADALLRTAVCGGPMSARFQFIPKSSRSGFKSHLHYWHHPTPLCLSGSLPRNSYLVVVEKVKIMPCPLEFS